MLVPTQGRCESTESGNGAGLDKGDARNAAEPFANAGLSLHVERMTCEGCATDVENAIRTALTDWS